MAQDSVEGRFVTNPVLTAGSGAAAGGVTSAAILGTLEVGAAGSPASPSLVPIEAMYSPFVNVNGTAVERLVETAVGGPAFAGAACFLAYSLAMRARNEQALSHPGRSFALRVASVGVAAAGGASFALGELVKGGPHGHDSRALMAGFMGTIVGGAAFAANCVDALKTDARSPVPTE